MIQITIQKGLWYNMYGYLFIFIISIVWFGSDMVKTLLKKRGA